MYILRRKIAKQREYSSRAQKLRRERYDVLKGQAIVDLENKEFHRTADKVLGESVRSNIPSTNPKTSSAISLKSRAIINDKVSENIKKNPNITKVTTGMEGFENDMKVLNKKLARSGATSTEQYLMSGGNKAREEKMNLRPRGVKKVKGQKTPVIIKDKIERISLLNQEHRDKFHDNQRKQEQVKASIARHEAKATELRAKKQLARNRNLALAVGGAAGIGYGAKKLYDKKKKKEN